MQRILEHFHSNGYSPGPLTLDGKTHRFRHDFKSRKDKKESGWYCGFQNHTSSGALFHVVRYGCWGNGEEFQYQTDSEYSPRDRTYIKEQIAKQKLLQEKLLNEHQERVAADCKNKWESLQQCGVSGYLNQRGISELFGARLTKDALGGTVLYVPLQDCSGKIWSYQSIGDDGAKRFKSGGRVKGCFHQIGELTDAQPIRICEGFATGITIHLATQEAVFVAFNSGNLLAVAQALRTKYPEHAFVVHGDDDAYTRKPDGSLWNPGKEAANEAAARVMGVASFPAFQLPMPERTDFDDLRQAEGIEAVTAQLITVKTEKHYVIPLGYDGADYYFLSNVNPQIQKLGASQLTSSGLCRLQPLLYWESIHPAKSGGTDWSRAADALMQACHIKGIFRSDRVRGCGVWSEGSEVVYHRGTLLCINDEQLPLHRNSRHSKYIYELSDELPPLHPSPITALEGQQLLDVAHAIRWKRPESATFYAGWLAVSMIGGALKWRPHLWITGVSGSGKSYVMQEITYPLLQDFSYYFLGQTTEAGIRQKTGCSTLPIIFDEFETDDDKSAGRVRAVLELARQASSSSDGIVAKGTVSGTALEFKPQFCMCVGSIRVNLPHEQDENRFTVIEIARPGSEGQNEQFDRLLKFRAMLGADYGHRLFSRMVGLTHEVKASAETFQRVLSEKYPMRVGQQYGALLAGYWLLTNDQAITEAQARSMCAAMDFTVARAAVERADEEDARDHLLGSKIKVGHGEFTVGEALLAAMLRDQTAVQALGLVGIKYGDRGVGIAQNGSPELERQIFRNSKWSMRWTGSLERLAGAKKGQQLWIAGKNVRGITLAWESLGLDAVAPSNA